MYYKKEDMLACIDRFYEEMMKRSEDMKLMENYRTGENYAYLGLPAHFCLLMNMWHLWKCSAQRKNAAVLNKLKQIVMLGRQAGFFLILACQRPDAKYLGDGTVTSLISVWLWGGCRKWAMDDVRGNHKGFLPEADKRAWLCGCGNQRYLGVLHASCTKGHDFLKEIKKLIDSRQGVQAACEAKSRRNGLTCCGWCSRKARQHKPPRI